MNKWIAIIAVIIITEVFLGKGFRKNDDDEEENSEVFERKAKKEDEEEIIDEEGLRILEELEKKED